MEKEFFIRNRKRLAEKLEDNSVLVLFSGDAPFKSADYKYKFVVNRNFYYITGFPREKAIFLLAKYNGSVTETLFIERHDPIMAKWVGDKLLPGESSELTGIEDIRYVDEFKDSFAPFVGVGLRDIETVYLDIERREFDERTSESQDFANELIKKYPFIKIKNCFNDIADLRLIKTEEEIEILKRAIDITKEGIDYMMLNARPNMMECELQANFEFILQKRGVKFTSFNTIIGSGKNGTVLHYEDNDCVAKDGTLVLADLGAQVENYCADITRTFPVNGKFTGRQKEVYNAVLTAQKEIEAQVKAGAKWNDINEFSKKALAKAAMSLGLIKEESEVSKYYFHTFGHSLGLDTHDVGQYRLRVLETGMIFTNEPGLYIEEEGIGVRIEDDLLVTEDGCINLSKHIIKEVDEIEAFMSQNK